MESENTTESKLQCEITFPDNVQAVLDEVFPSNDPLENTDFNVVDHINSLFPNEQSLSNIDEVVAQVENRITDLSTSVKQAVRHQTSAGSKGQKALEEAQLAIQDLFTKIKSIQD